MVAFAIYWLTNITPECILWKLMMTTPSGVISKKTIKKYTSEILQFTILKKTLFYTSRLQITTQIQFYQTFVTTYTRWKVEIYIITGDIKGIDYPSKNLQIKLNYIYSYK